MTKLEQRFKINPQTNRYSYQPALAGIDLQGRKYKKILTECSSQLGECFEITKLRKGTITRLDIVQISQEIGLPLKTTCEFLEYQDKLPSGTWDRKFAGLSVKDLIALQLSNEKELAGEND
jgi:hypothetical protein